MKRRRTITTSDNDVCSVDSIFNLHTSPPRYSHEVKHSRFHEVSCFSKLPIYLGSFLEFYLDRSPHELYLFSESLLYLELKLIKRENGEVKDLVLRGSDAPDKKIHIIPYISQTIIKRFTLEADNEALFDDGFSETYAEEAYLKAVTDMTPDQHKLLLSSAGTYFEKSAKEIDSNNIILQKRLAMAQEKPSFPVFAPIAHPFMQQKKAFPGTFRLKFTFYFNSANFCIIDKNSVDKKKPVTSNNYDIEFVKAKLLLFKITPEPGELARQQRRFKTQGYSYKYPCFKTGKFLLAPQSFGCSSPLITYGKLPKRVFIMLRKNNNLENYKKSPFKTLYASFISDIHLIVGENKLPLSVGYNAQFNDSNLNAFNYLILKHQLPQLWRQESLLNFEGFKNNYCIYPFSLLSIPSSYGCVPEFRDREMEGTMTLNIKTNTEIIEHIQVMYFLEYDCYVTISPNAKITNKFY